MSRPITLTFLATLLCCRFIQATDVNLDQIRQLARTYFRDSAEIPMSVDVTVVVTDAAGKVKRQIRSAAGMVFNGYNQGSGKFSLRANAAMFSAGAMHDSVSGDLAAFFAGSLIGREDPTRTITIEQPAEPDKPLLVAVKDAECPRLDLMPRWMFPQHACGSAQFRVSAGAHGGLMFQHFSFYSSGPPAAAKITYLGDVQLLAFHAEVDFQEGTVPGDPNPYLWPRQAVTSVKTSKGSVTITNRYSRKK
jgi:hypothetical protein